jgi:arylsulfatase/arylsulfatase A
MIVSLYIFIGLVLMIKIKTFEMGRIRGSLCHALNIFIFLFIALDENDNKLLASDTKRPNVIVILTDDQGFGDVGFNGNPLVRTPHLDAFAENKAHVFERFYASPLCSPTRASLMTGRYNFRTRVIQTQAALSNLSPSEVTLAEVFKSSNYSTGLFGKWHLGDTSPFRPSDQGFDQYLTHVGGMIGAPYSPLGATNYFDPVLINDGEEKQYKGYCHDIFTEAALGFIDRQRGKPFFMYLAPNTPHHPLTVSDHYAEPYRKMGLSEETSRYYGMITNIDDNFSRLITHLEHQQILDNTIIVFMGDNGTSSLHKQKDLWECGLRGRKTYIYENGIRVPMFIHVPGQANFGRKIKTLGADIDVFPTLLDLCGIEQPENVTIDGESLVPLLYKKDPEGSQRTIFRQWHRGHIPIRYRNIAVLQQQYKLLVHGRKGLEFSSYNPKFELYDISADPFESINLVNKYPKKVQELRSAYDNWFDEIAAGNDFSPLAIHIGTKGERVVHLTRQDWCEAGLFDGECGYYKCNIITPGYYHVICSITDLRKTSVDAYLQVQDTVFKRSILYAESEVRFENVKFKKGQLIFKGWTNEGGNKSGYRFIKIVRSS